MKQNFFVHFNQTPNNPLPIYHDSTLTEELIKVTGLRLIASKDFSQWNLH